MLRYFTLVPLDEIVDLMSIHRNEPEKRMAQKRLAQEVTELVHGEHAVTQAETATETLFGRSFLDVRAEDFLPALEVGRLVHYLPQEALINQTVVRLATSYGLTPSATEAKQLTLNGGLYLNDKPVPRSGRVDKSDLLDNRFVILRAGKTKHVVLALQDES